MHSSAKIPDKYRPIFLAVLFLVAFAFRFYNFNQKQTYVFDEMYHVPTAVNYVEKGFLGPEEGYHPPLRHLLMYAGIRTFGNNPYGWRLRNIALGSATVVALFLLAESIFGAGLVAYGSAALLLLDPLHIATSRGSFDEIQSGFFLVCAVYFVFKALSSDRERDLVFAGVFFGLSAATKWYAFFPLFCLLVSVGARQLRRHRWKDVLKLLSYLLVLPATIYLLAYIPWFLRGNSIPAWVRLQRDAFWSVSRMRNDSFTNIELLRPLGNPLTWFLRPISVAVDSRGGSFFTLMNNFPVWIFLLPAVFYLLYTGIKESRLGSSLVAATFLSLYIPFLLSSRPSFLYSAVILLPFCFIALAFAAEEILGKYAYLFLAGALSISLFLYTFIARGAAVTF